MAPPEERTAVSSGARQIRKQIRALAYLYWSSCTLSISACGVIMEAYFFETRAFHLEKSDGTPILCHAGHERKFFNACLVIIRRRHKVSDSRRLYFVSSTDFCRNYFYRNVRDDSS